MKTKNPIPLQSSALILGALGITGSAHASGDYGPAIWNPNCGQYNTSGYGHKFHVVHDMEGYYASTISYFKNCNTQASVHYCVNGKQDASSDAPAGEITQMVSEAYYAWHALCWNGHCTGTEHEGFASNPAWYTETMYQASAGISRHEAEKFGYAKDRNHIVAHGQKSVAGWSTWASANLGIDPNCNTHTDPGPYWDWNHYMVLVNGSGSSANDWVLTSGNSSGPLSVVPNADGRLEILAIASDNTITHAYQNTPNGSWSGWSMLGQNWQHLSVTGIQGPDGRAEVMTVGTDHSCNDIWQLAPNGGWSSWLSQGPWVSSVSVGRNADGRLEVFGVGSDGVVYHKWQNTSGGAWGSWTTLGDWTHLAVTSMRGLNGRQDVFTIGADHSLNHAWQVAPNGSWSAWETLGGWHSSIAVSQNQDGRMEAFGVGSDGVLYHRWQGTVGGVWGSWTALGNWTHKYVTAIQHSDGRMHIFTIGLDGACNHIWQVAPNGAWSGWATLGGINSAIAVGRNQDGHLEVFGVGTTKTLYHTWESGSGWAAWAGMGGSLK